MLFTDYSMVGETIVVFFLLKLFYGLVEAVPVFDYCARSVLRFLWLSPAISGGQH
jgi:hypothetical protein